MDGQQHHYEITLKKNDLFINLLSDDASFMSRQADQWYGAFLGKSGFPLPSGGARPVQPASQPAPQPAVTQAAPQPAAPAQEAVIQRPSQIQNQVQAQPQPQPQNPIPQPAPEAATPPASQLAAASAAVVQRPSQVQTAQAQAAPSLEPTIPQPIPQAVAQPAEPVQPAPQPLPVEQAPIPEPVVAAPQPVPQPQPVEIQIPPEPIAQQPIPVQEAPALALPEAPPAPTPAEPPVELLPEPAPEPARPEPAFERPVPQPVPPARTPVATPLADVDLPLSRPQPAVAAAPTLSHEGQPDNAATATVATMPAPPVEPEAVPMEDFEAVMDSLIKDLEEDEEGPAAAQAEDIWNNLTSLADLCDRSRAAEPEDYLLFCIGYLNRSEGHQTLSLKKINSTLVKSGLTPVNHSVLETAVAKGVLALAPDLNGTAEVSEYSLTPPGWDRLESLL